MRRDRLAAVGEVQRGDPAALHHQRLEAAAEADGGALPREPCERRIDEGGGQRRRRDQRATGLPPLGQRLADDGAGKIGRAFGWIEVERRQQERLP